MSYSEETYGGSVNHWDWVGRASDITHSLWAFIDSGGNFMNEQETRTWRRITWACTLRHCTISMHARIPCMEYKFQVSELSDDDFDTMVSVKATELLPQCTLLVDADLQRRLAQMCIEMTKLCSVVGNIFEHLYDKKTIIPRQGLETFVPSGED